jgi:uncharacterized integral membrane protein
MKIYKTIIKPVVTYSSETLTYTEKMKTAYAVLKGKYLVLLILIIDEEYETTWRLIH